MFKFFLELSMKEQLHPDYQEILFVDSSTGYKFVCGSTLKPDEKETFEGKEYPVYRLSVSSSSHPFFTKSEKFIDTEGRVDKFTKRYKMKQEQNKKDLEKKEAEKDKKKPAKKRILKKK